MAQVKKPMKYIEVLSEIGERVVWLEFCVWGVCVNFKFYRGSQNSSIQFGNTLEMQLLAAYISTVYFKNKADLKSFKEGWKAAPNRFAVKIILRI